MRLWKGYLLHKFEMMTQITYMMNCLIDSDLCLFRNANMIRLINTQIHVHARIFRLSQK